MDVLEEAEVLRHRVKGRHLRALCLALQTWQENPQDIFSRLWLGDDPQDISNRSSNAKQLLKAGFSEFAQWIHDQGGAEIKGFLGEIGAAG